MKGKAFYKRGEAPLRHPVRLTSFKEGEDNFFRGAKPL